MLTTKAIHGLWISNTYGIINTSGRSAEVAHLFWEQRVTGSIPVAPIPHMIKCMEIIEVTVEEAEERLDEMLDGCETGQVYAIVQPDGSKVMMVPADPSLIQLDDDDYAVYRDHDDAC